MKTSSCCSVGDAGSMDGHTGINCKKAEPTCRKCAGTHLSSVCDSVERVKKCNNCVNLNNRGATLRVDHYPTDDRCKARKDRIDGLKSYYKSIIESKIEKSTKPNQSKQLITFQFLTTSIQLHNLQQHNIAVAIISTINKFLSGS